MTAETLKPFITPQNVESCPTAQPGVATKRRHRNTYFLAIGLSTISLILLTAVIGYTIFLSMRVNNTETENARLNRVIDTMQKRLGLHYLDEIEDFEKEYANTFTDDPTSLDDLEGDYDDTDHDDDNDGDNDHDNDDDEEDDKEDKKGTQLVNFRDNKDSHEDIDDDDDDSDEFAKLETYDEIREYMRKSNAMSDKENYDDNDSEDGGDVDDATDSNHEDSSNTSEDDNLYGDFENYKDSKKKKENARITRSITQLPHESAKSNETKIDQHGHQKHSNTAQSELRPQLRSESSFAIDLNTPHFVSDKVNSHRFTPLRPRSPRQRKFPIVKSAKNVNNARQTPSMARFDSFRPAAHFHLNRKVPERHGAIRVESYLGDMYIGHHPSWSNEVGTQHYFTVQNGVLTVREPGLYYVYAQICYNNTHDQNGFVIFHGHTPFLQCLNTVPTNLPLKIHTCHTSGLIYLRENETIHLRDFHSDRNVILKDSNNRSYFGLIKV